AAAEVGEEVLAELALEPAAAIDEAAGHRATLRIRRLGVVRVVEHRLGELGSLGAALVERLGLVALSALEDVPSVVDAAGTPRRLDVDLLAAILADVADVKVTGRAIEAEAPRVAE